MSSSVEPKIAASDAAQSASDSEKRIGNLKNRASKAAKDDFLRELGKRLAHNPSQTRCMAPPLGLQDEEEKNVKALAVLGSQYPEVFQEILQEFGDLPDSSEEDAMPGTRWGEEHYRKIAQKRMEGLWGRIFQENNIAFLGELQTETERDFPLPTGIATMLEHMEEENLRLWQARAALPKFCGDIVPSLHKIYIFKPTVNRNLRLNIFQVGHNEGIAISITADHAFWQNGSPPMYVPRELGLRQPWQRIRLVVGDKKHLRLANKLAAAYERETRRRRSPAKAVVVKNY